MHAGLYSSHILNKILTNIRNIKLDSYVTSHTNLKPNIMAQKAPKAVPDGMYTVTPTLIFNGNCREAIAYYQKALKAELVGDIYPTPDGKAIWHAMIKIGNSNIMLCDAMPGGWEKGPEKSTSVGIWLYLEDCDALFNNAVKAGGEVVMPPMDMFWGDRMGKFKDPYGHSWTFATTKWIYTPEESKQKQDEMMSQMSGL